MWKTTALQKIGTKWVRVTISSGITREEAESECVIFNNGKIERFKDFKAEVQ